MTLKQNKIRCSDNVQKSAGSNQQPTLANGKVMTRRAFLRSVGPPIQNTALENFIRGTITSNRIITQGK